MPLTTRTAPALIALTAITAAATTGCEKISSWWRHSRAIEGQAAIGTKATTEESVLPLPLVVIAEDDNGKSSLLGVDGHAIAAREWDSIDYFGIWSSSKPSLSLIPVNKGCIPNPTTFTCNGGKWGYIDRSGKTAI